VAQPYDGRTTVEPKVSVAITRHVWLTAGVSTSRLDPLVAGADSEQANAWLAGAGYQRTWRGDGDTRHDVTAGYDLHAGTEALASDLDYRRHLGYARYQAGGGRATFIADVRIGRITGRAPLFERFTLGDTSTLRGWNKYDLAPAGARRLWHQSVEFRYRALACFLDAGALWDDGVDHKVRLGTGIGLHTGSGFLTVGFPLNADEVNATVMIGARF
jgi:outer membrane translocation and assembly module TamA